MVYRVYVEKRPELAQEARALLADLRGSLQITNLTGLRLINRYDVEHIDEALFAQCVRTVFSEPQVDRSYSHLEHDDATLLAVEYLPGQFDQRADSAAQCIQILSQGERPTVRTAKVYALYGAARQEQVETRRLTSLYSDTDRILAVEINENAAPWEGTVSVAQLSERFHVEAAENHQ